MSQLITGCLIVAVAAVLGFWGTQIAREGWAKLHEAKTPVPPLAVIDPPKGATSIGTVHGNIFINSGTAQDLIAQQTKIPVDDTVQSRSNLPAPALPNPIVLKQVEGPVVSLKRNQTKISGGVFQASAGPDGKIYIAGSFTAVGGEIHVGLARLHANGTVDSTFKLEVESGGFSFGFFPDGSFLFCSWQLGVLSFSRNGSQNTLFPAVHGQRILIVNEDGSFYTSAGKYAASGAPILKFTGGFEALAMVVQSDGKKVLGGVGGRLARLTEKGSVDITFTAPEGIRGGNVHGVGVQSDGKVVVTGGAFALFPNVFRLNSDGTLDESFKSATEAYGPVLCLSDGSVLISSGNGSTSISIDNAGRIVTAGSITRLASNGVMHPSQLKIDPSFAEVSGVSVYLPLVVR